MKSSLFFFILCSFLIIACNTNSQSQKTVSQPESVHKESKPEHADGSLFLINSTEVAGFSRGEIIDSESVIGDGKLKYLDGASAQKESMPNYIATFDGRQAIKIIPAYDPRTESYTQIIGEIIMLTNQFQDSKGIMVGSSLRELFAAYPQSYAYYDIAADQVVLSDQGYGLQYITSTNALKSNERVGIGRIAKDKLNMDALIQVIRIVRSAEENQDAKINSDMEEKNMLSDYWKSLAGKYFLNDVSENYYKIHNLQGSFYVSECFEGDCNQRGKIIGANKNVNGYIDLELEGIQGEMVPSWSIKSSDEKVELFVRDYDADTDEWSNRVYTK